MSSLSTILVFKKLFAPKSFLEQVKESLLRNEFIPYFQPLVESKEKKVTGIEVLMRWNHPTDGIIPPDLFIPQAEASGLIVDMTKKIIIDTAYTLKKHEQLLPEKFHVGFNITPHYLEQESIIEDCIDFFYKICHIERFTLIMELTERNILNYNVETIKILKMLSLIGVKLALDDFGTGHSSLTTLQNFHFDCIKIDKSFTARISDEPSSRHIVDSVISLAKKLELSIVAEGVENNEQETYLRDNGVDFLQGYLYSPPLNKFDFFYISEREQNRVSMKCCLSIKAPMTFSWASTEKESDGFTKAFFSKIDAA